MSGSKRRADRIAPGARTGSTGGAPPRPATARRPASAAKPGAASGSRGGTHARPANRTPQRPRGRGHRAAPWWQRPWLAPAAVAVVAAVVLGIILLSRAGTTTVATQPASASLAGAITSVPASTLATVGDGGTSSLVQRVGGLSPLTGANGKPEFLVIGADYCPYCAAERWSVAVALARFGTVGGLQTTASSSSDVFPNTDTLNFAKLTYSSQYLDVSALETEDRDQNLLSTPSPAQTAVLNKLDAPPYSQTTGAIPFIDIANQYVQVSSSYSPQVLQGLDWDTIASALKDPGSPVAKGVLGGANRLTAAICKATNNQPASVCALPSITQLEAQLPVTPPS